MRSMCSARRSLLVTSAVVAAILAAAPAALARRPDPDVLRAIREEGFQRSEALEIVSWLSDVYGPRVTGTPAIEAAKEWAAGRMRSWGLRVREERFAYGRGWSLERFHAHLIEPQVMPIIGYPRAWTPGTDGPVTAGVVRVDVGSRADLERHRGRLRGKIVLAQEPRAVRMLDGDLVLRMDGRLLAEAARPPAGNSRQTGGGGSGARLPDHVQAFFVEEGVVAVLDRGSDRSLVGGAPLGSGLVWPTQRTDGGTVFVGPGGPRAAGAPEVVPAATIAVEHYNRMIRVLDKGLPVTVELDVRTRFHDEEERPNGFNLLADLPGTDLAGEVVILGAHFDSTHAATGATDNAAGVAAMMEAARILQAIDARPRRTIRVALWGGEEEGLLGSREYVRRHYADPETMAPRPDHATVSAYYNLDNGAGRIRGIWLQGNAAAAPLFEEWMRGLGDLGVTTVGRRSTRGTDHRSFDAAGLPGFQFIQDRLEYSSRTHHSNMDFYDRVQPDDLRQMAVVAATFAYRTAMRDERLPRKPPPAPRTRAR